MDRYRLWIVPVAIAVLLALQGCSSMLGTDAQPLSPAAATGSAAVPSAAEIDQRVAEARSRRGDYYANRLAIFLKDTPTRQPGGMVFVGDSITERFPVEKAFPNVNAVNRGIGGDKIAGVLERLDVSIEHLRPSRVYLMIGTNNLLFPGEVPLEQQLAEYDTLLSAVRGSARGARVTVISVPPLAGGFAEKNPQVSAFNESAREIARNHKFQFVDLHPWMTDERGALADEYTDDGVHFTVEGYQAWLEAILPYEEFSKAASSLAPLVRESHRSDYPADTMNPVGPSTYGGGRGPDQLVVYTPAYGKATTGTNPWGIEAMVRAGKVVHVGGNNSSIPPDGYVISGHGKAAAWIQATLTPGMALTLEDGVIRTGPNPVAEQTAGQRVRRLQREALDALSLVDETASATAAQKREARELLESAHELRMKRATPATGKLEILETRMRALHDSIAARR